MGYMGLEHAGSSDAAADLFYTIFEAMAKILKAEVKEDHGGCNTAGCINVAFFFDEIILPAMKKDELMLESDKLLAVANTTVKEIDKLLADKDWDDKGNRDYHFKAYRRLRKSVQKYLDHYTCEV